MPKLNFAIAHDMVQRTEEEIRKLELQHGVFVFCGLEGYRNNVTHVLELRDAIRERYPAATDDDLTVYYITRKQSYRCANMVWISVKVSTEEFLQERQLVQRDTFYFINSKAEDYCTCNSELTLSHQTYIRSYMKNNEDEKIREFDREYHGLCVFCGFGTPCISMKRFVELHNAIKEMYPGVTDESMRLHRFHEGDSKQYAGQLALTVSLTPEEFFRLRDSETTLILDPKT